MPYFTSESCRGGWSLSSLLLFTGHADSYLQVFGHPWKDCANVCNRVPFAPTLPSMTLVTDASSLSWGALWGDFAQVRISFPRECLRIANYPSGQSTLSFSHQWFIVQVLVDNTAERIYLKEQVRPPLKRGSEPLLFLHQEQDYT